jgi:hypothetical protein
MNSISKLIQKYKHPFDAKSTAYEIAVRDNSNKKQKYHGLSCAEILKMWNENGTKSGKQGTHFHEEIQNRIEGEPSKYDIIEKSYEWLNGLTDGTILLEEVNENIEFNCVGILDCVFVNENNRVTIVDWKTNKKLKNNFGNFMKEPFNHLICQPLTYYELQLSIYMVLKELEGYEFEDIILFWAKSWVDNIEDIDDTANYEVLSYKNGGLRYLKEEAMMLLEKSKIYNI